MTELKPPPVSLLDKHLGTDFLPLYTATVRVSGGESRHGRASGVARSDDGILDLQLRMPEQLGGPGGGTNPEQLFAAGYAACFLGAMKFVAGQEKVKVADDTTVTATVGIGPRNPAFRLLTSDFRLLDQTTFSRTSTLPLVAWE